MCLFPWACETYIVHDYSIPCLGMRALTDRQKYVPNLLAPCYTVDKTVCCQKTLQQSNSESFRPSEPFQISECAHMTSQWGENHGNINRRHKYAGILRPHLFKQIRKLTAPLTSQLIHWHKKLYLNQGLIFAFTLSFLEPSLNTQDLTSSWWCLPDDVKHTLHVHLCGRGQWLHEQAHMCQQVYQNFKTVVFLCHIVSGGATLYSRFWLFGR